MNFNQALAARVSRQVQVSTEVAVYPGILMAAGNGSVTVRRTQPYYGPTEDVVISTRSITFVRVLSFE